VLSGVAHLGFEFVLDMGSVMIHLLLMRGRGEQHEVGPLSVRDPREPGEGAEPLPANVHRLDVSLFALSGEGAALRLGLGQALEVLQRAGHCFALGFSSCAAYALERCDRSARWVEAARCLARRLEELPAFRQALAEGALSWSAAELVSRVARCSDEAAWLERAQRHTVRQLRELVRASGQQATEEVRMDSPSTGATLLNGFAAGEGLESEGVECEDADGDESCVLTCTVNREDAWVFESTRRLLEQLGTAGTDAQVEALLAEGQEALLSQLPRGSIDFGVCERLDATERRWREQLKAWQEEAERRCEALRAAPAGRAAMGELCTAAAGGCARLEGLSARELDERIRQLSRALARHELLFSQGLLAFHHADGWRRLGYATEAQYARERLGISRSSLVARRSLAARLEALPAVSEALGSAQIGVEAALQLVRIATPRTERVWLDRARQRTVKHLREEVGAALTAVRLSGEADCPPPEEAELDAYAELERAVLSGKLCQRCDHTPAAALRRYCVQPESPERRAWQRMLGSLATFLGSGGIQMSAARATHALASAGRVMLRLRVSRANFRWWRGLEVQALRWLPRGMSWLRFLCLGLWHAWRHLLGVSGEYGGIYLRDGYRCRSPVCSRRDVTPHHLRFRSQGGGDEAENLATVCSWCHLFGIHGGRIRAEGTARHIRWELGPTGEPCLVVDGRDRVAA
jgi:hypothetical protein